jgi:flagellar basal body P-ring protein FlgI
MESLYFRAKNKHFMKYKFMNHIFKAVSIFYFLFFISVIIAPELKSESVFQINNLDITNEISSRVSGNWEVTTEKIDPKVKNVAAVIVTATLPPMYNKGQTFDITVSSIGDAKSLTEAFNPDAKFKALSASLSGVAGGFAAYQGAMGLVGVESKDLEKFGDLTFIKNSVSDSNSDSESDSDNKIKTDNKINIILTSI